MTFYHSLQNSVTESPLDTVESILIFTSIVVSLALWFNSPSTTEGQTIHTAKCRACDKDGNEPCNRAHLFLSNHLCKKCTLRSCSIGTNRFRLVGLVELIRVLLAKNHFPLAWLLNFFNLDQTGLKRLKKHWSDRCCFHWR